ncbi:MAG: T9SS type A sorting domain-containing protein [Calditrichaeota bacterium]|nr:T9SS type A sorting domain-containing protein [Calditrichota bacterium]
MVTEIYENTHSKLAFRCLLVIGILSLLAGKIFAFGLNVELDLAVPEGGFYVPGDTLVASLVLTDNDDNILRADVPEDQVRELELYVSGPRQNYMTVEPYYLYQIKSVQNGFDADAGYNPETGELQIYLPEDLGGFGTYTIFLEIHRRSNNRWFDAYPQLDFQVGQVEPTTTFSNLYLSCGTEECHENPSEHDIEDITSCVICHTHNSEFPWNAIEHNREVHVEEEVEVCCSCHLAHADINKISRQACFTCHPVCQNVDEDIDNEECFNCHDHPNDDFIYTGHSEPIPLHPEPFDLSEPSHQTWVEGNEINLAWNSTEDFDTSDVVTYELEVSQDPDFAEYDLYRCGDLNRFWAVDLQPDAYYLWRVRAVDWNTEGRYSTQTWRFQTAEPQPPTAFSLVFPVDGDTARAAEDLRFGVMWQTSYDPDPESILSYTVYYQIQADSLDTTLVYNSGDINDMNISILDSIGIRYWENFIQGSWWVDAISGLDTTRCDSAFSFYITPNPNGVFDSPVNFPQDLAVTSPYPNPFNSTVHIGVTLPITQNVRASLFDVKGSEVGVIVNGPMAGGSHVLKFSAGNLTSGLYLVRINVVGQTPIARKVLLVR